MTLDIFYASVEKHVNYTVEEQKASVAARCRGEGTGGRSGVWGAIRIAWGAGGVGGGEPTSTRWSFHYTFY